MEQDNHGKGAVIIDLIPYLERRRGFVQGAFEVIKVPSEEQISPVEFLAAIHERNQYELAHRSVWDLKELDERRAREAELLGRLGVENLMNDSLDRGHPGLAMVQRLDGSFTDAHVTPEEILTLLELHAERRGYVLTDPYQKILDFQLAHGIDNRCRILSVREDGIRDHLRLDIIGEVPDRIWDYYPEEYPRKKVWREKVRRASQHEAEARARGRWQLLRSRRPVALQPSPSTIAEPACASPGRAERRRRKSPGTPARRAEASRSRPSPGKAWDPEWSACVRADRSLAKESSDIPAYVVVFVLFAFARLLMG